MILLVNHALFRLRKSFPLLSRLSIALLIIIVIYLTHGYLSGSDSEGHVQIVRSQKFLAPRRTAPIDPQHLITYHKLNPVVVGWGEDGQPVTLTGDEAEEAKKQFSKAAFNVYLSDRISPNRSLPEVRPDECSRVLYPLSTLGQASIVIIYTNEIWSALLRTIWSVVNRSPPELLREIILVDDFSTDESLKAPLDQYIADYFGGGDGHEPLVRVIRLVKREGLIRARLIGEFLVNKKLKLLFIFFILQVQKLPVETFLFFWTLTSKRLPAGWSL